MKVALYLRVSTQEQAKEGYSIGEQEVRLKKYCEAMEWMIYKIYVDPGYSGGDTNRPGLQDLIKDVKSGGLDKVVVYKLDRLSRSQLDTLYLIEKVFLANGTDFVSMSENFDTSTPFGRAMIGILAVFAQLEREQIKERMGMGKEARAKLGKWNGGSTEPIGYDYNIGTDLFEVNEYEAMQLKELAELFLKGTPLRTIETIFFDKGYKHKHGNWTATAMRRVLRNKIYCGYIHYGGEYFKADHEAIFDEDTHKKLVKLLDERLEAYRLTGIKSGAQSTYLGGLLYCKQCGAKYSKNDWKQRNGSTTKIYSCYSRSRKVRKMVKDPNCKNKNWKRDELNNIVFDEIKKFALDPEYIRTARMNDIKKTDAAEKIKILEKEIENIDAQISRFMDLYGIGKFTIDQVSSKVDPLNEERIKLSNELNSLTAGSGELTDEEIFEIVQNFEDVLERNDFTEIRHIIDLLISYVEIDNDDIYIHWNFA